MVLITGRELASPQQSFSPHHVQNVDAIGVLAIEDATRRLNQLAVPPTSKFLWLGATLRMVSELRDMVKDALHKLTGGIRIL